MSTHCAVSGCSNGGYRLIKWREKKCEIHDGYIQEDCACAEPFK